jgi:hypothetical protein
VQIIELLSAYVPS